MRVKSTEYKFWKKKQNEKNLIKRTQRKTSNNSSKKNIKEKIVHKVKFQQKRL